VLLVLPSHNANTHSLSGVYFRHSHLIGCSVALTDAQSKVSIMAPHNITAILDNGISAQLPLEAEPTPDLSLEMKRTICWIAIIVGSTQMVDYAVKFTKWLVKCYRNRKRGGNQRKHMGFHFLFEFKGGCFNVGMKAGEPRSGVVEDGVRARALEKGGRD